VSAFGVSGTNAHVILEQVPRELVSVDGEPAGAEVEAEVEAGAGAGVTAEGAARAVPWVLSAHTPRALAAQAARLAAALRDSRPPVVTKPGVEPAAEEESGPSAVAVVPVASAPPAEVAAALVHSRALLAERAVVLGEDHTALAAGLDALARGAADPHLVRGRAATADPGRHVFVFPGQGAQWVGMGRELLASSPVFAARFDECAAALAPHVDWSPRAVVAGEPGAASLERVDVVQPALWAVMVSLAAVWESLGVRPDAVVGHSQGEIAAAVVAGALSVADGALVVARRARALVALAGRGGMASVELPPSEVARLIAEVAVEPGGDPKPGDGVATPSAADIAVINGPASVVVSGTVPVLVRLVERAQAGGARAQLVQVDYASHSAQIEALEEQMRATLAEVRPSAPVIPMFSTVTGDWITGAALDAGYWYANLRQPVGFHTAVTALEAAGFTMFVEVSPHPVLAGSVAATLADGAGAFVVSTLRRDDGGLSRLLTSAAEAFVRGVDVDFPAVLGGASGRSVRLPRFAFDRTRYWLAPADAPTSAPAPATAADEQFWEIVRAGRPTDVAETLGVRDDDTRAALDTVLPALSRWWEHRQESARIDAWRHRVVWRPWHSPGPAALAGHWLLVVPESGPADPAVAAAAAGLRRRGAEVITVSLAPQDADRAAVAREIAAAVPESMAISGVLSLLALSGGALSSGAVVDDSADTPWLHKATLALVQALVDIRRVAPLWLVTRGAVATGADEAVSDPDQALLWGLGPIIGVENPDLWGGVIDLDDLVDPRSWELAADAFGAVTGPHREHELAVRRGQPRARRLVRDPRRDARPGSAAGRWRPRGTALITGGTGALGGHVARWLARQGAEHLVLVSRRGEQAPGAAELVAQLRDLGAEVTVAAGDVGDARRLREVIADLPEKYPLRSVFHAAATLDDAVLDALTLAQVDHATGAKINGARHLDALTRGLDLDRFVLFSSVAGVCGVAGQGNYAPGNAFLDALADWRRAAGLPATTIGWGHWAGGGIAAPEIEVRLGRYGLTMLPPEQAVEALGQILDDDDSGLLVCDIDWAVLFGARGYPLVRELLPAATAAGTTTTEAASTGGAGAAPLAGRIGALPLDERQRALTRAVQEQAAVVQGHPDPDAVDPGRTFAEQGFDSVTALELRNRLATESGLRLPAGIVFDHPTPAALAGFLLAGLGPAEDGLDETLAGIERVAARGSEMDSTDRALVAIRLREVLARLDDVADTVPDDAPEPGAEADVAARLAEASDAELIDIIGKTLGIS